MKSPYNSQAFTLIELLTVIAIIAVLMGLLFSAMGGVKDAGNKAKAKNDLVQIVTSVKMYYAEYGKYPLAPSSEQGKDTTFTDKPTQDQLFNVLRANGKGRDDPNSTAPDDNENPRRIVFLDAPYAKDPTAPKGGIASDDSKSPGVFFDPWGTPYSIRIDGDYDNNLDNPYSSGAGPVKVNTGIIAWSLGKDHQGGSGDKTKTQAADDVVSWQ